MTCSSRAVFNLGHQLPSPTYRNGCNPLCRQNWRRLSIGRVLKVTHEKEKRRKPQRISCSSIKFRLNPFALDSAAILRGLRSTNVSLGGCLKTIEGVQICGSSGRQTLCLDMDGWEHLLAPMRSARVPVPTTPTSYGERRKEEEATHGAPTGSQHQ